MSRLAKWLQVTVLIALVMSSFGFSATHAQAQETSRLFPETGQTVSGRFLEYWTQNGGLMQQGYPISGELQEKSAIDGKTYTVQYFERAVFEKHPENARPYDVLLSLLGVLRYNAKYPTGAPAQRPNDEAGSVYFPETGKRIGGSFLVYFNQYGGVPQQGLPISDEFMERSDLDGKVRVVQYFQRAVFEWNPENKPPFNVLLSQLGTFAYKARTQPAPVLLEPALPGPLDPSKEQRQPQTIGQYLIWSEGHVTGPQHNTLDDFDLRALDLTTNQPLIIADAPGNQLYPEMDGSLVVWQNKNYHTVVGAPASGIYAKDMATGKTYQIGLDDAGKGSWTNAVVAGRNVVTSRTELSGSVFVESTNVDTGAVTELFRVPATATVGVISGLQGSGRFLIWGVIGYSNDGKTEPENWYTLYTYDLQTGKLTSLFQVNSTEGYSGAQPAYSLEGNRLAIADKEGIISVMDLLAGTQVDIEVADDVQSLELHGNTLLITTDHNSVDIVGLDITKPELGTTKLLGIDPNTPVGEWPRYGATLAGDWLVWSDQNAIMPRLSKKKLELKSSVEPGTFPTLPKPDKHRAQYIIGAYGFTILYWDCPVNSFVAESATCVLRSYNLNSNQESPYVPRLTSEQAAELMLAPGNLLVWRLVSPPDCSTCTPSGIYAVDLTSGKSYTVASGLESRYSVAAYGHTVVWVEREEGLQRIMGKNIDTGVIKTYREVNRDTVSFDNLHFSDVFLVWNEQDVQNLDGNKSSIVAFNIQTGEMKTIHAYNWTADVQAKLRISMDLERVAIKLGNSFFVYNLRTDQRIDINESRYVAWMQISDEIVVYSTVGANDPSYGTPQGTEVYALHLDEPAKVYTIVPQDGPHFARYTGTLSMTYFFYVNNNAQQPRMNVVRLPNELLNREK